MESYCENIGYKGQSLEELTSQLDKKKYSGRVVYPDLETNEDCEYYQMPTLSERLQKMRQQRWECDKGSYWDDLIIKNKLLEMLNESNGSFEIIEIKEGDDCKTDAVDNRINKIIKKNKIQ